MPTITPLPPAPNRGLSGPDFVEAADAFLDAMTVFADEVNTIGEAIDGIEDAAAAAQAAAAAAATFVPALYVTLAGTQTVPGRKTFADGVVINGQTLNGVTSAGKALVEAADAAAQKALLGVTDVPAVGAIGSQVIAASNALTGAQAIGATAPGSSLYVSNLVGDAAPLSGGSYANKVCVLETPTNNTNLGFSGTWRLMSRTAQTSIFYPVGLWVRIA